MKKIIWLGMIVMDRGIITCYNVSKMQSNWAGNL